MGSWRHLTPLVTEVRVYSYGQFIRTHLMRCFFGCWVDVHVWYPWLLTVVSMAVGFTYIYEMFIMPTPSSYLPGGGRWIAGPCLLPLSFFGLPGAGNRGFPAIHLSQDFLAAVQYKRLPAFALTSCGLCPLEKIEGVGAGGGSL